jgi:6-phosphogluconolactonase
MTYVKPDVRIFQDLDSLSHAAAEAFVGACSEATTLRGRFLATLSGGTTPLGLYELLARSPFKEHVDWARSHLFWGDERCVPPEDLENSYGQTRDILLSHVPVPAENVHRIRSELEPEQAAQDYARVIAEFAAPPLPWPMFDLVLLGLGTDGHTASLFPGSDPDVSRAVIAVTGHYRDRPARRVTLTPPVFNSSRRVIFLVGGEDKAVTLAKVLNGEHQPGALPAQRIQPSKGELIWMVDRAAASQL